MKNHFSFDRELTNLELLFWKDFFNNFPIISFKKIHSLLDRYINSFDNLNNDFEQIKNLKSKDDLFIFFKQIHGDFSIKTLNFIEQLNPQVSIPEMFLSVIYFAYTEDLDLNITKNGLSYNIENNKLFLNTSYTSEIGMISDLMAGRLQELMPSLQNINPVSLSGEFSIETYLNNEKMVYFLKIEEHDRTFFHSNKKLLYAVNYIQNLEAKNASKMFNFASDYSSSENSDDCIYSPLELNQKSFLNLVSSNFLNNRLNYNNDKKILKKGKI